MAAASISRAVTKVIRSVAQSEGAGVTVRRTIGGHKLDYLDPFLLLDEFNTENPDDYIAGFPDHPHRGFETVTYMLEGKMLHQDHKGNKGLLGPGAVQWMTAGRGIIHSEMPQQENGKMHGYQMWVNLPAKDKMCAPRYQDFQADKIPVVKLDNGATVKIMTGRSNGVDGAVSGIATAPLYLDVDVPANTDFTHDVPDGHTAWAYVITGEAEFGNPPQKVGQSTLVIFQHQGDKIAVKTGASSARFLLAAARPLNEPMARYGPFVMNTQQEIMQAFKDYQSGKLAE